MAQHDYVIANGTGAAVRSDLNNALSAIVSQNSGATEPATMYAYQWWADTTTGLLKIRNAANNAWVTVGTLASANLGLLSSGSTVTAALGSASTPGITFTGDTNTGIYSPGADQVAISTNGSGRLFVDSSGQVGIGTSSPVSTLTANSGASNNTRIYLQSNAGSGSTNAGFMLGFVGTDSYCYSYANGNLLFGTNNAERMRIDSSGRVGIGTTSPGYLLHLLGSTPSVGVQDSGANGTRALVEATNGAVYFGSSYASSNVPTIFSQAGASGGIERMRIDTSGRLLVGTSTSGTSTGMGQLRLGGAGSAGGALFLTNAVDSIANNGTLDITVGASSIVIYVGFLIVHSASSGTNALRTQTTYSVFGSPQNSSFTATQIATATGAGTSTFTVTSPSAGVIRVTNTSGGAAHISMCFMGTGWFMT